MSKGKKLCYFCGCNLTNQNQTATVLKNNRVNPWQLPWVGCCHGCKFKKDKKPRERFFGQNSKITGA